MSGENEREVETRANGVNEHKKSKVLLVKLGKGSGQVKLGQVRSNHIK